MSSSTSASSIAPSPREAMKASTATSPKPAASQKPRDGDSPARSTANTAVQAGSSAITTAPWVASTWRSAIAVNSGNATTTPNATIASERHCAPWGRGARSARRTIAASTAATAARPKETNIGSRSATASRVAGSENEKIATPSVASDEPAQLAAGRVPLSRAADNVTLCTHALE